MTGFSFAIEARDGAARTGLIATPRGRDRGQTLEQCVEQQPALDGGHARRALRRRRDIILAQRRRGKRARRARFAGGRRVKP